MHANLTVIFIICFRNILKKYQKFKLEATLKKLGGYNIEKFASTMFWDRRKI